jgi:catechol 2,3-dioxygenase-like lactoylglutathione lyase family enzyme
MRPPFIALCFVLAYSAVCPAADVPSPPVNHFRGMGINVANMETSIKFYTSVFGFKVAKVFPENAAQKDGREVVLNMTGQFALNDTQSTSIVLAHLNDNPLPEGRTAYGRMVMVTSDAEAITARAESLGGKVTKGRDPRLIFVTDPDGYRIEVFQP